MTTRDSNIWWVGVAAGFFGSLAAQPDTIDSLMALDPKAIISVLAMAFGIACAKMQTSPLPLSPEGKAKYDGQ